MGEDTETVRTEYLRRYTTATMYTICRSKKERVLISYISA